MLLKESNKKFTLAMLVILLVVSLFLGGIVSAQSATPVLKKFSDQRGLSLQERSEMISELETLGEDSYCLQVSTNVDARKLYYAVVVNEYYDIYSSLSLSLDDAIAVLAINGTEVSELQEISRQLKVELRNLGGISTSLDTTLSAVAEDACLSKGLAKETYQAVETNLFQLRLTARYLQNLSSSL